MARLLVSCALFAGAGAFSAPRCVQRRDVVVAMGAPMTRAEAERVRKLEFLRDALPDVELALGQDNLPRRPPPDVEAVTTLTGAKITIANATARLAGGDLVVQFECFDVYERCLVLLDEDGTCCFTSGLVGEGDWRCVPGDVDDGEDDSDVYVEFSQQISGCAPGPTRSTRHTICRRTACR